MSRTGDAGTGRCGVRWKAYEAASGVGGGDAEGGGGATNMLGAQFTAETRAGGDVAIASRANVMGDGIEVPVFSIRADSIELLVDAKLSLRTGHRYGLVAPNGKGKTTLLKAIGSRALTGLPRSLDVLYVEQEVRAAVGESAIEALLRSDSKRSSLLAEEVRLESAIEAALAAETRAQESGDAAAAEAAAGVSRTLTGQLVAVYDALEAHGSEACEARARSLLAGLGIVGVSYAELVFVGAGSPSPTAGRTMRLVRSGIYAYSRNPSVIGKLLGVLAVGLALNSFAFCCILVPLLLTGSLVEKVWRQEPVLVEIFGEEYERYRAEVPLFFPWTFFLPRKQPRS